MNTDITITVAGRCGSGKSLIISELLHALLELGLECKVDGYPDHIHRSKQERLDIFDRMKRNDTLPTIQFQEKQLARDFITND